MERERRDRISPFFHFFSGVAIDHASLTRRTTVSIPIDKQTVGMAVGLTTSTLGILHICQLELNIEYIAHLCRFCSLCCCTAVLRLCCVQTKRVLGLENITENPCLPLTCSFSGSPSTFHWTTRYLSQIGSACDQNTAAAGAAGAECFRFVGVRSNQGWGWPHDHHHGPEQRHSSLKGCKKGEHGCHRCVCVCHAISNGSL